MFSPTQATGQISLLSFLPSLCPKYSTPSASYQLPLQDSLEALASFLLQDEFSLQTFNPHSSCPGRSLQFSFQIAHFLQLRATPPNQISHRVNGSSQQHSINQSQ